MNKVVIFIIVFTAAIVASLGVLFVRNIEEITREMVEAIGSQVVGSRLQVEDLQLSLAEGAGHLAGLTLPDFTVRDLGTSTDGLTPDLLGKTIVMELALQVKETVDGQIRELTKERALYKLKERIEGKALEGVEKLKKLLGSGI